ncbi:MAG TPA: dephospho-CoA kinase [Thioalkalivibrio sp.]|nr:dephospho-CoA kinase [Thioalkalivibrio sp.]
MLRIGLTGGIGCGKSTVAELFARHGVPVIDSDRIAREVVEPGEPALRDIIDAFGSDMLQADGHLDRAALRELVFHDAAARERLNAIVHPRVRDAIEKRLHGFDAPYGIVVVPLLIEAGMTDLIDRVLVVDCDRDTQLARIETRDGMDRELAEAIIATQAGRETRLQHADDVIDNSGRVDALATRVAELDGYYRQLARGV